MNSEEILESWLSNSTRFDEVKVMLRVQTYALIEILARLEK